MTTLLFQSVLAVLCFADLTGVKGEVCQKPACTSLANEIQKSMDGNIDRCNDFYNYACGKWAANNPIGPTIGLVRNRYFIANETMHGRLRDILDAPKVPGENLSLTKAKDFHMACMGRSRKKHDAIGAVKNFIEEAGGWPIIMTANEWQRTKKSWQAVHSKLSSVIGLSPIFTLTIDISPVSRKKVLSIEPPTIGNEVPVPKSKDPKVFIAEPAVVKYLKVIKDIAKIVKGPGANDAQLDRDAREIFMFENNIRNNNKDPKSGRKYNTIDHLQTLYNAVTTTQPKKNVNWLTFINEIFAQTQSSSGKIQGSTMIYIKNDLYFKSLCTNLADTTERAIVNTIHWWFIKQTLNYENTRISEVMKQYVDSSCKPDDPFPQPERWWKCVTDNPLQGALGFAYGEKYFPDNARAKALQIIEKVRSAFKKKIEEAAWMEEPSKVVAKKKLKGMAILLGGPEWYRKSAEVDKYYESLSMSDFHFRNVLRGIQFTRQKEFKSLNEAFNREEWTIHPFLVNAAYIVWKNSMFVSFGILEAPFFHIDYPDAVNYAGMGMIAGHEMSHGFDKDGSINGKDGKSEEWWTAGTKQKYETQTQCFKTQFDQYQQGLSVRTMDENTADATGLKTAFKALKDNIKKPGFNGETLPGFGHLTAKELFFLSYASS